MFFDVGLVDMVPVTVFIPPRGKGDRGKMVSLRELIDFFCLGVTSH